MYEWGHPTTFPTWGHPTAPTPQPLVCSVGGFMKVARSSCAATVNLLNKAMDAFDEGPVDHTLIWVVHAMVCMVLNILT